MKRSTFNMGGGEYSYEAPALTLLEVATERGFALSTEGGTNEGWGDGDETVDW